MNKTLQTIRLILIAVALVIAYLFALNGRYTKIADDVYFDKWKKTILIIQREETVK